MKTATIFLVALAVSTTLFLEYSTAAVGSTACEETMKVDKPVKKSLDEAMKATQKDKIGAIKIVDDASQTATEVPVKESLNKASWYANNLLSICIRLHKEMNDAFASGCCKALIKVLAELIEAINKAKGEWPEIKKCLANVPADVRAAYIEGMEKNFVKDDWIKVKLEEVLAGACNTAGDSTCEHTVKFDESVKKSLDGDMKYSQKAKLSAIKFLEDGLVTAVGDDVKEVLNGAIIWSKELEALGVQLNQDMNNALNSGCIKDLAKVVADFAEAIKVKEPELNEWIKSLEITGKDVQENFSMEMNKILDNDIKIAKKLEELLAGCNSSVA